jgi:hypothetical protein
MMLPDSLDAAKLGAAKYKGAWVVMPRTQGRVTPEQREAQDAIWQVVKAAGAHGQVTSSRNELVITSGSYNVQFEEVPTDVVVMVRASDYDAIVQGTQMGYTSVEFMLDQAIRKGPVKLYNVIADITGTEFPDEIVIVSGHLDSWDGPGSTGTCDNGTGTMVALEAARLLGASGAKPKRTIRFIMWTGEEQGLHGSRRYVEMHRDELSKISAVFVDDGGTNYSGGLVCVENMKSMLEQAVAPVNEAFPDLPITVRVQNAMPRGGGSDHAPFNQAGVPGFFWSETGVADYNYVHHTQHDNIAAAINAYLVQSSVAAAVTSYNVACADSLLPRAPAAVPSGGGGGGGTGGGGGFFLRSF